VSITSTLLIFVLVPAAIVAVIAAAALAGGGGRRSRRYRPGRPYDFTPIWFLAAPEQVGHGRHTAGRARTPAIESGEREAAARVPAAGSTGGASDRW
jgi:hypothetical protein